MHDAECKTPAIEHPDAAGTPDALKQQLIEIGRYFHTRGWSVGTSSNYSCLLSRDPMRLLITSSGKDKGRLGLDDFVMTDEQGKACEPVTGKPSAETLLHIEAVRQSGVGCVLHTHSVWGTILSEYFGSQGGIEIEGFEMLKGLEGIRTHETRVWVEIFENTQDMAALAEQFRARLEDPDNPLRFGMLLRRHGLYTWGKTIDEARRHIEIFEFLFEVLGRELQINPR